MFRKLIPGLSLLLFAAACSPAAPPEKFPEITFQHMQPINLNVARIEYAPRYKPPVAAPNVGHDFPVPPVRAAENWIRDRLRATGASGVATVRINSAVATENKLKVEKGLTGLFTTDQAWRYEVVIDVTITAVDPNRQTKANAQAVARRSRTVPEDISLADREAVWFDITDKAMADFNSTFELQIRKYLDGFIQR